jgi:hypothetical protein
MTKISAYTTTKDVIQGKYPVEECLSSVSAIVDEVIVFDSSIKNDGTRELLTSIAAKNDKIKLHFDDSIPWNDPNHGIYDGITKTKSRGFCTGDVLFQIDIDEVIHEKDVEKWKLYIADFAKSNIDILATPVIEFWGQSKIRIDINPIKERLTKNKKHIIHGIPGELRYTKNGLLYARQGTDGCNLIDAASLQPLRCYAPSVDFKPTLRGMAALNEDSNEIYSSWFTKNVINSPEVPSIYHYSWFSIKRKIETYKNFWAKSWASLYGDDPVYSNPMFPSFKNEEISNEMIETYAKSIELMTAGWIFHKPWDGTSILGIDISGNEKSIHPSIMEGWISKNR